MVPNQWRIRWKCIFASRGFPTFLAIAFLDLEKLLCAYLGLVKPKILSLILGSDCRIATSLGDMLKIRGRLFFRECWALGCWLARLALSILGLGTRQFSFLFLWGFVGWRRSFFRFRLWAGRFLLLLEWTRVWVSGLSILVVSMFCLAMREMLCTLQCSLLLCWLISWFLLGILLRFQGRLSLRVVIVALGSWCRWWLCLEIFLLCSGRKRIVAVSLGFLSLPQQFWFLLQ